MIKDIRYETLGSAVRFNFV